MTSVLTSKATRWVTVLVATALVLAFLVGGEQRSATAIGPGETKIVYVADGYNFPDALMGATLAALNNAPMLGVRGPNSGDFVPERTAAELDRLTNNKANKLDTIYIFGGPAAVSDNVKTELAKWANDVQRISGDDRFGTMEAISKMLPTKAKDSDLLDGKDSTAFLGKTDKATDADKLDGKDSTEFLGASAKATDSDLLDGNDASAFVGSTIVTRRANVNVPDGGSASAQATCQAGEVLIAGGAALGSFVSDVPIISSRPSTEFGGVPADGDTFGAWRGTAMNPGGGSGDVELRVFAVCASIG